MEPIAFLNGISSIGVAVFTLYLFIHLIKYSPLIQRISRVLLANGVVYFIFGLVQILWSLSLLDQTEADFTILLVGLMVTSCTLLLYATYKLTEARNLLYLFLLFLVSLFSIHLVFSSFSILTLAVCLFLFFILFSELAFFSNVYLRMAGFLGIMYSVIIGLYLVLIVLGFSASQLFWCIPFFMMLMIMYYFYKDMRDIGVFEKHKVHQPHKTLHLVGVFLKFFIFIVAISAFTFVSVLAVHEFGHALVGQYYGCETSKAVLYDAVLNPHTELSCSGPYNDVILTLAGLLATLLLGFIFLLAGDSFTLRLSNLIFGFSFLFAFGDLLDLGLSVTVATAFTLLAFVLLFISIIRLSVYYLAQQHIFGDSFSHSIDQIQKGAHRAERKTIYSKHLNTKRAVKKA